MESANKETVVYLKFNGFLTYKNVCGSVLLTFTLLVLPLISSFVLRILCVPNVIKEETCLMQKVYFLGEPPSL